MSDSAGTAHVSTGGSAGQAGASGNGATGGAGQSGAGGTAGSGSGENCANGLDDDGDELVDCADDDCAQGGFVCVADAPADWDGPYAFYSGETPPPECPSAFPELVASGGLNVMYDNASCPACNCAAPTGLNCQTQVKYSGNTTCSTGGQFDHYYKLGDGCTVVTKKGNYVQLQYSNLSGSCASSTTGSVTTAPHGWSTYRTTCAATQLGGGCASGEVCAGKPSSPYATTHCISRLGTHLCPTPFTQAFEFSSAVDDTRSCSQCGCASPAGASCTPVVTEHASLDCTSSSKTVIASCQTALQSSNRSLLNSTSITGTPSCMQTGGSPTGSVKATDLTTVCCVP